MKRKRIEKATRVLVFLAAAATSTIVFGIFYFLVSDGFRVFSEVKPAEFFLSKNWYPTYGDAEYGIFALVVGTFSVTGLTLLFSIPLGFAVALYLAEFSSPRWRNTIKSIVELMAGLPSVVLGSFGLKYLSKFITDTFPEQAWTGLNIMNASIVLTLLSMPYFVTLMEDALRAVPHDQKEASLSIGADMTSTIFKILVPQAKSGITNAIILGTNRVIGETMVVLMVAGGAGLIPESVFDPVRTLTAAIAGEMGEVELGSTHYNALFMIGVVLLAISTTFTLIALRVKGREKK